MPSREASRFFEEYAGTFDDIYGEGTSALSRFINRRFRASMRLRLHETLAGCEPLAGKHVLDVGCGPGHYVAALAGLGASRVVGIDSAPSMIERAQQRCKESGVAAHCELLCTPFETYPDAQRFDHVVCMGFLEYVAEPKAAIASIMRRCRESAFFSLPDRRGLLAWQRRVRYRFRTPLFMYSRAEVGRLFESVPEVGRYEVKRLARDFFITARPSVDPRPGSLDSAA